MACKSRSADWLAVQTQFTHLGWAFNVSGRKLFDRGCSSWDRLKKVPFNNNPLTCISLITAVSVINSYLTKVFQCGNGVYINSIYIAILIKVTDSQHLHSYRHSSNTNIEMGLVLHTCRHHPLPTLSTCRHTNFSIQHS